LLGFACDASKGVEDIRRRYSTLRVLLSQVCSLTRAWGIQNYKGCPDGKYRAKKISLNILFLNFLHYFCAKLFKSEKLKTKSFYDSRGNEQCEFIFF
jgi:hypothetical protein